MSLRWTKRIDKYKKDLPVGLHGITISVHRIPGVGVFCTAHLDKLTWLEEDDCYYHEARDNQEKKFFTTSNCLEFIHRYLKHWTFTVDDLETRTYYFGRQNSHYEKE